ncbi:helix-turn-helix domain-containing protein [Paraglaciecola aestuariivivens]
MTIFMSLLFCVMLLSNSKMQNSSTYLLAAFMAAHALMATHELTFYAVEFRYEVIENLPNFLFVGSLAYCFDAIILYFYVNSIIYKDFSLKKKDFVYLIPAVSYLIYLIVTYYSLSHLDKIDRITDWQLAQSWHFVTTDAIIKLIRLIFIVQALVLITHYYKHQKERRADISAEELNWLTVLLKGFLVIISVEALLSLLKVLQLFVPIEQSIFIAIGLSTYYSTMLLVVFLLFYCVTRAPSVIKISREDEHHRVNEKLDEHNDFKPKYIAQLESYMDEQKPYLTPEITIETLAQSLGFTVKDLSVTLNRHFEMNFYEFINNYRINEAKQLLIKQPDKAITDIYFAVGFNSKSVFYNFFKKKEGMTPSEFRKTHQQAN